MGLRMKAYKQAWVFTFRNGDIFLVVIKGLDRADGFAKARATFDSLEPWDHATYPCDAALELGVTKLK